MYLDRSFCMEGGQVKSGATTEEMFSKMLQQVHRVTPQVADTIMGTHKSVSALVRAFQQGGPHVLEDLVVCLVRRS
jgi:crossover junction endonuclease EME1